MNNRQSYCLLMCLLFLVTFTYSASAFSGGQQQLTKAPDWIVKTTEGKDISLRQELSRGHRVVVVFWATWCRYCKMLLPELQKLAQEYKEKPVTFISMNVWQDGKSNSPQDYLDSLNVNIPLTLFAETIAQKYRLNSTPGVYLVGQEFNVLYQRSPGESIENVILNLKQNL